MSLLDSFPFDHGSPFFSFMWHWCLTLFWNISASWNNLCLAVPRKVEFVILYLSFLCLILGKRDVCRLLWTRCLEPLPSLEWFSFSPTTTLTTHFFLHLFCQIVFFSGLSTSLYQVSSCHWLRTPDRNHLQKKEVLFGLIILQVLACGQVEHHGEDWGWIKLLTSCWPGSREPVSN